MNLRNFMWIPFWSPIIQESSQRLKIFSVPACRQKTLDALKKVLDEQQYIGYLRYIGKGKDYKKGKDGKWYLKSELKKQSKNPQ